jgi:hypothetical protein
MASRNLGEVLSLLHLEGRILTYMGIQLSRFTTLRLILKALVELSF